MKQDFPSEHWPNENIWFYPECKYCGCNLAYDSISRQYVGFPINIMCISDEEKMIKDLLE